MFTEMVEHIRHWWHGPRAEGRFLVLDGGSREAFGLWPHTEIQAGSPVPSLVRRVQWGVVATRSALPLPDLAEAYHDLSRRYDPATITPKEKTNGAFTITA
jgi:hypothetical protein